MMFIKHSYKSCFNAWGCVQIYKKNRKRSVTCPFPILKMLFMLLLYPFGNLNWFELILLLVVI